MAKKRVEDVTLGSVSLDFDKERHGKHMIINEHFGMTMGGGLHNDFMSEGGVYLHHQATILMITSGNIDTAVDMEDYLWQEGDIVLLHCDTIQEKRRVSDDFDIIAVSFGNEIEIKENQVLHADAKEWREVLQMMQMLWAIASHEPFRKQTVYALVAAIISNIEDIAHEQRQQHPEEKASKGERIFTRFKQLVNEHADRERTVTFYADQLFLTPHHLSLVVKNASGKTVMQWINRAVILRAKVLLKTSDLMTYEIAERLHFPDHATFSKFFKRETGLRPQEYREKG
jgi:AraC-like DNA-binding protein